MAPVDVSFEPTFEQLMVVIRTQTEIARLGLDLNDIMAVVTRDAQAVTRATGAIIELVDRDEMVYRAVVGSASGQLGLRLGRASSLSGRCVEAAKPLRCDDSETDPRVDREACRKVGLRSMIVVPLIHLDQAVGVLKVLSPTPAAFGEGDVKVLGLLSDLIAAAMYNATRYGVDELFRAATRDGLTGLANRALFYDRLRHALAQAKRRSQRMGVLMLDMDGLKPINDTHGHRAGDAALREFAARISKDARQSDTVARLGGDEFAVVLSTIEGREGALLVARRVVDGSGGPFGFEGTPLRIGASIGVAVYPDDGDAADVLVEKADQEMYMQKRERKLAAASRLA